MNTLKKAMLIATSLASMLGCPIEEHVTPTLVLKLAEGEPPRETGLGVVLLVQARGGEALTLEAVGGSLVHPLSGASVSRVCVRPDAGALALRFMPEPEVEAGRVLAHLWAEEPTGSATTLDCGSVETLIASAALLFDPKNTAAPVENEPSSPDETETGETETGP